MIMDRRCIIATSRVHAFLAGHWRTDLSVVQTSPKQLAQKPYNPFGRAAPLTFAASCLPGEEMRYSES